MLRQLMECFSRRKEKRFIRAAEDGQLDLVRVGGTNCTSVEALARFFDRLSDTEPSGMPAKLKQPSVEEKVKEAQTILRHRGLIK